MLGWARAGDGAHLPVRSLAVCIIKQPGSALSLAPTPWPPYRSLGFLLGLLSPGCVLLLGAGCSDVSDSALLRMWGGLEMWRRGWLGVSHAAP